MERTDGMGQQLQEWIEKDAQQAQERLSSLRKKKLAKTPLGMLACVAALVALGFVVGADVATILRLHLLLGLGIALVYGVTAYLTSGSLAPKTIVKAYARGAKQIRTPEDERLFLNQMSEGRCDVMEYLEDGFPSKVIIGPDYWVYRGVARSDFIKVADIESCTVVTDSATIHAGEKRRRVAIGRSIVVRYKKELNLGALSSIASLSFNNDNEVTQAFALIEKHCPQLSSAIV